MKKRLTTFVGFLFWLLMAGMVYYREHAASAAFALATAAGLLVWCGFRFLWSMKPEREKPSPESDLPEFDFKNVKPSDFE